MLKMLFFRNFFNFYELHSFQSNFFMSNQCWECVQGPQINLEVTGFVSETFHFQCVWNLKKNWAYSGRLSPSPKIWGHMYVEIFQKNLTEKHSGINILSQKHHKIWIQRESVTKGINFGTQLSKKSIQSLWCHTLDRLIKTLFKKVHFP